MKKQILTLAILSATSLTFLSACGSGSGTGTGIDSNNAPTTLLPDPVAALADRVASLRNVGTYNNGGTTDGATAQNDDTRDYTYSEVEETFALRVRDDETLIMTINGSETILERQGEGEEWRFGNSSYGVILTSTHSDNSLHNVLRGGNELIHGTYVSYSTDINDYDSGASSFDFDETIGYAAVGIKTPASVVVSQTATATYLGHMRFRTRPERVTTLDAVSNENYNSSYDVSVPGSGLTMEVDFDANTIAGTGNIQKYDSANGVDIDVGVITFASAPITGNGFEGTFTLDRALRTDIGLTNNPTGNYSGNFFGPDVNNLAGVMRFNGTNANGVVLGIGGFSANKRIGE